MTKQIDNSTATEQFANVQDIKKGTFVKRTETAAKVYVRCDFDRGMNRYYLEDESDSSNGLWVKRGTKLFTGFTY